jgi:catechol 2,3-dioxygenase-like lactoylglutathione lyase family enzyme
MGNSLQYLKLQHMIDHTSVGVSNYERSKELYTQMLAPLGYSAVADMPEYKVTGFADGAHPDFWVGEKDKASGGHTAFVAKSSESVEAFYNAALQAGATDNGAPGYRAEYAPGYYAAFVHDFDGNNIEAVWMDTSKK